MREAGHQVFQHQSMLSVEITTKVNTTCHSRTALVSFLPSLVTQFINGESRKLSIISSTIQRLSFVLETKGKIMALFVFFGNRLI